MPDGLWVVWEGPPYRPHSLGGGSKRHRRKGLKIVCDSTAIADDINNFIVCVIECIPHGESQKNISVGMYITHSSLCGNVCARWPNTNSSLPEAVCDCELMEHATS